MIEEINTAETSTSKPSGQPPGKHVQDINNNIVTSCDWDNGSRNVTKCGQWADPVKGNNTFRSRIEEEISQVISLNAYVYDNNNVNPNLEYGEYSDDYLVNDQFCVSCTAAMDRVLEICDVCTKDAIICERCNYNFWQVIQDCINCNRLYCPMGNFPDSDLMTAPISPTVHTDSEIDECRTELESDIVFDAAMGFNRYKCYAPVLVNESLQCYKDRSMSHYIAGIRTSWNLKAWEHELSEENDIPLKSYIDHTVRHGVLIVDQGASIPSYECSNYTSATTEPAFSFLNELIHKELYQNRLVLCEDAPHCIHAIGAVPKKDGGWRPITDCRRPLGYSINNYMGTTFKEFSYHTVDEVCHLITPGCYMATIDIEAAYRTVTVFPSHWKYQGLHWPINGKDRYLMDTSLCFGLRCAPYAFNQISNFVTRCLKRRGFSAVINYLDDFWIHGKSFVACQKAQMTLIEILGSLGFSVSFKKCTSPSTKVTYLGIEFNSETITMALPQQKMQSLMDELKFFHDKPRVTVKQIQRLCGIVSHASKVVKGRRTFSRRMLDLLKGMNPTKKRIRLSNEFIKDLQWWESVSTIFNGTEIIIPHNDGGGLSFISDSSNHGYGYVYGETWRAGFFNSSSLPEGHERLNPKHEHWINVDVHLDDPSINILEMIPVWLCVHAHAHEWTNMHVLCYSDNSQVVAMINKGTSRSSVAMAFIRSIFWSAAVNNFYLTARHVRGVDNKVADALSRIFSKGLPSLYSLGLCCSRQTEFHESGLGCLGQRNIREDSIRMGPFNVKNQKLTVV